MIKKFSGNQFTKSNLKDRFWSKINICGEDECWNWVSSLRKGYGKFKIDGKTVVSHRFVYELVFGKIPNGMCVLHKCDNPACCNPKHLFLGSNKDNTTDMIKKERDTIIGERNNNSKLTEIDVLKIRSLYKNKNITIGEISDKFGVCEHTIRTVATGEFWKHIDRPCKKINRRIIKLDYERADEIRRLYKTGKYFQIVLAEMFGVSQILISLVIRNKIWMKS